MTIVPINTISPQPWRNGAGTTRQLAEGVGWRVSLAQVAQHGPFSVFEAMWRHSIVVNGEGLQLSCQGLTVSLLPHELSRYFGGIAWDCRLQGEAATVLNIMCETQVASADILIGRQALLAPHENSTVIVLPVNSSVAYSVDGGPSLTAGRDTALLSDGDATLACQVTAADAHRPAYLAAIRLRPLQRSLC